MVTGYLGVSIYSVNIYIYMCVCVCVCVCVFSDLSSTGRMIFKDNL